MHEKWRNHLQYPSKFAQFHLSQSKQWFHEERLQHTYFNGVLDVEFYNTASDIKKQSQQCNAHANFHLLISRYLLWNLDNPNIWKEQKWTAARLKKDRFIILFQNMWSLWKTVRKETKVSTFCIHLEHSSMAKTVCLEVSGYGLQYWKCLATV